MPKIIFPLSSPSVGVKSMVLGFFVGSISLVPITWGNETPALLGHLILVRQFRPAAFQMLGQEGFRGGVELEPIFRAGDTVAFVGEEHVFLRLAGLPNGGHDLLGLRLL